MKCPSCGCLEHYQIKTRRTFKCRDCYHQFSETSGTLFAYPKMPKEKRNKIIALLQKGLNPSQVSRQLGVQYKTVWTISKKIGELHG